MPQTGEDALRFKLRIESAQLEGQAVRLPPLIELGWYSGFFMGPRPQAVVVTATDTPEDMAHLGKDIEKIVLARGLRAVVEDRVLLAGNKTVIFR